MFATSLRLHLISVLALAGVVSSAVAVAAAPTLPEGDWRVLGITGAKATAHLEPHRPDNAFDGDLCTAWSAGEYPPQTPEALILEVPRQVKPVALGLWVRMGPLVAEPEWRDVSPSSLQITLIDGAKTHSAVEATLKPGMGWQWLMVPVDDLNDVTAVRLSTGTWGFDTTSRARSRVSEVRLVVEPFDESSPLPPAAPRPEKVGCSTPVGLGAPDPIPPGWRWDWEDEPDEVSVTLRPDEASLIAQLEAGQKPQGLDPLVSGAMLERMMADHAAMRRVLRTGARRAVRSAARFGADGRDDVAEVLGPWAAQALRLAHLDLRPTDVDEARHEERAGDVFHVVHRRSHARLDVDAPVTRMAFETRDLHVERTHHGSNSLTLLTYDAAGRLASVFRRETSTYRAPHPEPDGASSVTELMYMLDIEWRGDTVERVVRTQVGSGRSVSGERVEFARRYVLPAGSTPKAPRP